MVESPATVWRGVLEGARSILPGRAEMRELPALVRTGIAFLAGGLILDVLVHGVGVSSTALATAGHLLVLGGMLLALAGAVGRGLRSRP